MRPGARSSGARRPSSASLEDVYYPFVVLVRASYPRCCERVNTIVLDGEEGQDNTTIHDEMNHDFEFGCSVGRWVGG